VPSGTVNSFGETPLDVSVNVEGLDGGLGVVGVELPPPHDAKSSTRIRTRTATRPDYPEPRDEWQFVLLDDDSTLKGAAIRVVVIVVAARAGVRESERCLRLSRLQEPNVRNRRTVGMCRMRIRFHIVRTRGVIRKRHALANGDGHLGGADRTIRPDRDRGAHGAN
jgi:hypothetical protein